MAVQAGFSEAKPNQDRFVHFSVSTKDVAQIVWKTDVNFQLREACMLLLNFHEAGQTWADIGRQQAWEHFSSFGCLRSHFC